MASGPTITAKFLADTSDLTSGVDRATDTAGSKMDSFAKNAAIAIGGAFVVDKVVEFGKAAVDAAAADAEAQASLALALKNTTGATDAQVAASEAYISNLSKSAAITDDELRPALATLARGFGDTEEAQKALTVATDIAAGTGKDLSSVTEAMMKAAQGNTGALKKMGIATEDASGNALSLDQIMANAAKTFEGQAAVAAGSTAGQMRSAEIAMGELQETIGTALLPIVGQLATILTDTLLPAIEGVFGWIMDNKDAVVAALVAISVVLLPMFVSWAAGAAVAAAATIAAAAPFILVGAAVAALAYVIIHNWDTIRDATEAAFRAVTNAVKTAFNWIKDNWPTLLAILTGPIGLAVLAITTHWDTIKGAAQAVLDWFSNTWKTITDLITKPIKAAADLIAGLIAGVSSSVTSIVDAIKGPLNAVIRAWNGLHFSIPEFTIGGWDPPGPGPTIPSITLGGQRFDFPNLPELAAGGVLTSATMFIGGEAGTEIVTPEALMRQIIREEGGGGYTLNMYPRTADAADIAYGFRRLELMAGVP